MVKTDKIYWWDSPTKNKDKIIITPIPFSATAEDSEWEYVGETEAQCNVWVNVQSGNTYETMPDINLVIYIRIKGSYESYNYDNTFSFYVDTSEESGFGFELDEQGHIVGSLSFLCEGIPRVFPESGTIDIEQVFTSTPEITTTVRQYNLPVGNGNVQFGDMGFNMGFVIDGTKDSSKLQMISYSKKEAIKPNSLVWHENTNTWWVVSNDRVDRFENESGYMYLHTLQLEGAIELLNFKDLTDSGFNANYYTVDSFIKRLISLSNFNVDYEINYNENIDPNKNIDYVKTYENYTLLNALRDFLGGYNLDVKMSFTIDSNKKITGAILNIVSKTGNANTTKKPLSTFNEVNEVRNINKNSYGTSVITNAENVVSTQAKTYPSVGLAPLTGATEEIIPSNARLRLPAPIYKVNWLKLGYQISYKIELYIYGTDYGTILKYNHSNTAFNEEQVNNFCRTISHMTIPPYEIDMNAVAEGIKAQQDFVFNILEPITQISLYNCDRWNSHNKNWVKPTEPQDFYFPVITKRRGTASPTAEGRFVLCPKEVQDNLPNTIKNALTIGWERGKDYIEDFTCLSPANDNLDRTYITTFRSTDFRNARYDLGASTPFIDTTYSVPDGQGTTTVQIKIYVQQPTDSVNLRISTTNFKINYIPMTDIKVKYDSRAQENITQLYNQNGKLSDPKAISKLITSYLKEIESENITKYAEGDRFNDMPKVGEVYTENNVDYVVNSASYDFFMNEINENGDNYYYIKGEYSLSRNVATKSILTNPNTNVRDYGIPQNYNVKRKQVYRDFYELNKNISVDSDSDYLLTLDKVLNTTCYPKQLEHIAVIKARYEKPTGGDSANNVPAQSTWYYQLDTTSYVLNKALYEMVDFKDNNIIGYSPLNISSGFDISKLISGMSAMANTPVTYTDDNGRIEELDIAFCSIDQLTKIYDDYISAKGVSPSRTLYNASCFVDEAIYSGIVQSEDIALIGQFNNVDYNNTTHRIRIDVTDDMTEEWNESEQNLNTLSFAECLLLWGIYGWQPTTNEECYISYDSGRYYLNINYPSDMTISGELQVNVEFSFYTYTLNGAEYINDFLIKEPQYRKDSVEVPVFEYCCQIDDSDEVIIGDNILNNDPNDICYAYFYVLFDKDMIINDNNIAINWHNYIRIFQQLKDGASADSVVPSDYTYSFNSVGSLHENAYVLKMVIGNDNTKLSLTNYEQVLLLDGVSETYRYTHDWVSSLTNKQMAIFRARINNKYTKIDSEDIYVKDTPVDFVMLIKKPSELVNGTDTIDLSINHYKLK